MNKVTITGNNLNPTATLSLFIKLVTEAAVGKIRA
jgi:hypothetical protein